VEARPTTTPRFTFMRRGQFTWKVLLLAVTTIALAPILVWKHELAATIYLIALVVVHIGGFFVVAIGAKKHHIAPDTRGLVIRVIAIVILMVLLYIVSKGLDTGTADFVFWGSLFSIWALHTLGLALLHIRGRREMAVCPFA
jgi:hypothetical protein